MVTGKDFYGGTVTDAIAEACQEFSTSQEGLNIEILETGSSGIFGLCRKKAHIRAAKKEKAAAPDAEVQSGIESKLQKKAQKSSRSEPEKKGAAPRNDVVEKKHTEKTADTFSRSQDRSQDASRRGGGRKSGKKAVPKPERRNEEQLPPPEPPSDE
ncbi:MAG: hypothetical protein D3906_16795, partial [Candidatus Electrothrix sp. AUS1_2]|nr:hypothetical protein [Candidatus Electrothrix sp. AUS1_2]